MAKKTDEQKLVEQIAQAVDNHWFNPSLAAQILVNYPLYTQDKIMELMAEIIKLQAGRFEVEWQHNTTSQGLMLASHLAEVIEMHAPIE